ncbi:MAG: hypothetical protein C0402_07000 [Thermodesulfovibrio sp.]|nr:hypothetical protein [Thermodesulfovibrio sp.]
MKNSKDDLAIKRLYKVTKTPEAERFYPEEVIRDILTFNNKAEYMKHIEIVLFILRLFDVPEDLKGAGHVIHFVFPFLDPFLKLAGMSKRGRDLVIEVTETWIECLLSFSDDSLYFEDVTILESQLFRFHLEASGVKKSRRYGDRIQEIESSIPTPLYQSYGPFVHLCIRDFLISDFVIKDFRQETRENTIDEHIRSARMFFHFMQQSIRYTANHPPKIPEYYINNFVEEYDRIVNIRISRAEQPEVGNFFDLGERASAYKRYFCRLIKDHYTPIDQEDRNLLPELLDTEIEDCDFTQTAEGRVECYGKSSSDDVPDNLRMVTHSLIFREESGDSKIYGLEAPILEELIFVSGHKEAVVRTKPTLRRSWSEFIDLKKYFFFWDSFFINLYSYSRLYQVIETTFNEEAQSRENVICVFLMLLIHTGLNPRYLLQTQTETASEDARQSLPVIRKDRDHFECIIGLPIPERKTFDSSGCLSTYKNVTVPIFPFVKPYVNNLFSPAKKYLFSFVDKKGEESRIDLIMIRAFLKQNLQPYGLSISLEAIANSFFSLYSTRYGMDPVVACYISKNHYRIFNAPLHYIFVPKKHLFESYSRTSIKVHRAIKENMELMTVGKSIRTPVSLAEDNVFKAAQNERGYGSPQIPERETWITFVDDLKKSIKSCGIKQLYRRHNLYSIYLYFALMLATSLRPRNNPDIAWDTYNSQLGIMILADKLSPQFYEERLVPISKSVGGLIDGLRNNFPRFKSIVDDYLCPGFSDLQPSRLFFFLNENYESVAFELKAIKRILAEEYISFPLPLNTPRHYIRSSFYWENIHHELASIFMGHQTSGKEWLTDFSSVDLSEIVDIFSKNVESVLRELGFDSVQYLPAVR